MIQDDETVLSISQDEETVLSMSQDEGTVLSMSRSNAKMISKSEDDFSVAKSEDDFSTLLSTISSLAPSLVYDRKKAMRKRRNRKKKMICPELYSIWSNAATILTPVSSSMQSVTTSTTSLHPTVDWPSVNKRFLNNIPTPVSIPIHGCFPNSEDYEDVFVKNDYGGMQNIGSKFVQEFPFGSSLGFLTDAGPVNVPEEVFHGYIFQPGQGWLLHAEFPQRAQHPKKEKLVTNRARRRRRG